jgi:hypothetical protein
VGCAIRDRAKLGGQGKRVHTPSLGGPYPPGGATVLQPAWLLSEIEVQGATCSTSTCNGGATAGGHCPVSSVARRHVTKILSPRLRITLTYVPEGAHCRSILIRKWKARRSVQRATTSWTRAATYTATTVGRAHQGFGDFF